MADNLTEAIVNLDGPKINPTDLIYNDIKFKADEKLTQFEKLDEKAESASYFSSMFQSDEDKKVGFQENRINIDEAYTKLSGGDYITRYDEGYTLGLDNEQLYAQKQSTGSKWANGLTKFLGKTVVNVVGGTLGTAYGAISAIAEGNWEQIYNNSFYDFLDDQNTKMDNFVANYRTQEERDKGFFPSMGTANFWADDFLGGLSFMVGTVISENLWATVTGGTSLAITAAKIGLKASKYFNIAKGSKEASKEILEYLGEEATKKAIKKSIKYGKLGEAVNIARFTYTSAGFEAGMEARLYEREQRENFNRDFENLNGRKASAQEIAEFEDNLGKTTNMLWVTNMALVGTSNFAILGKKFGITSPFKLSKKSLNKELFGTGTVSEVGEAGERLATKAIKRTKAQRVLGFSKELLKSSFMEGFVEEGGQATASTAMESYLTSRYNPSEDAMGIVESMYDGLSYTYGTKEGWKEVGLGMLIGFVGGEGSNILSGQGFLKEARDAAKEQSTASVEKASIMDSIRGTEVVRSIFVSDFEEKLAHATEVQNAEQEYKKAEDKGSVIEKANAQSRIMLNSIKYASNLDILEYQIKDFEIALKMQSVSEEGSKSELAKHYDIEQSEVESKITQLVSEYKALGEEYKTAKEFADYIVSNNPKETYKDGTDINPEVIKTAIASQIVMAKAIENNLDGAHEALVSAVEELGLQISAKEIEALQNIRDLQKQSKEKIQDLAKTENALKQKNKQLDVLIKNLNKADQEASSTPEANQKIANKRNSLAQKIEDIQKDIINLQEERIQKRAEMSLNRDDVNNLSAAGRTLASQLDSVDPLASTDFISEITLEETQNNLEKLDNTLERIRVKNPQLVEKISRLGKEYKKGLEIWKRNADTLVDLSNPETGLNRIGTMMQRKKAAGTTTLEFLKRIQKTQLEDLKFNSDMNKLVNPKEEDEDKKPEDTDNEQTKAEKNIGDDILKDILPTDTENILQNKINELRNDLGKLLKDTYLLENFTNDPIKLQQEKAPTQEELDEYSKLRSDFKSGDINKLVGRPIEEISTRIKKRSGLSDAQILRYQYLSQKMLDWRIITGTNLDGVSIQDILNQIEAYQQEIQDSNIQLTATQVLETVKKGEKSFYIGQADGDIVQTMTYVKIGNNGVQTEISHLDIESLYDEGYNVVFVKDENIGTQNEPDIIEIYNAEKNGEVIQIGRKKSNHRIVINNNFIESFLKGMGFQTIKYNLKTAWGDVFKEGKLLESDFDIESETETLNQELIYNLKKGDKLSFKVNIKDGFNVREVMPLIKENTPESLEQAKNIMSIYQVNENNETIGLLKRGVRLNESNFNKIREEAFKVLKEKADSPEITLEDIIYGNSETEFNLPFEVEVEKVFIGSPNIELNEDGSIKTYKIDRKFIESGVIIGKGFSEKGKIEQEDENIRMAFIPKEKNTPYVIIKQGETKIAFPVGLLQAESNLQEQILDILGSDAREQDKRVSIVNILKQNGIEPAQFKLDILKDDTNELNRLLTSLNNVTRNYNKEEVSKMSLEDFSDVAEIVIDLDNPAFVSPKVKTSLSKSLINKNTKENTKDKSISKEKKTNLIIKHSKELAEAKTMEEVDDVVSSTGDEVFQKEFDKSPSFKKEVRDFAINNKTVPSIQTDTSIESLLEDVIDLNYDDVPLDIKQEFKQEVEDLKVNPTKDKIKDLSNKVKTKLENRYKLVNASINTENMYHIATTETEDKMFEQGYVRVVGDFYKKVDKKYDVPTLLKGLYDKYKNGTLPTHIQLNKNSPLSKQDYDKFINTGSVSENILLTIANKIKENKTLSPQEVAIFTDKTSDINKKLVKLKEGILKINKDLSLEEFVDLMPNTLLDIYKKYYNTQETELTSKKATLVGNEQYLKEEFKGDFAQFIQEEKKKGSEIYREVLQHFQITDKGILKDDLLTRDKIDEFQNEFKGNYASLLNYSLINKHIDLQEQPQNIIFVEDTENASRLEAVNSPTLPKPKGKIEIAMDGTVVFSRPNPTFVKMGDSVYEKTYTNNIGESVYEKIADIDSNFIITEVAPPFTTATIQTSKEIDETKSSINRTDGRKIDC